jgi:nondiscriminating glutamyl-tRNA synthetase
LFNWLLARHTGGTMVLRIEDTDTERSTPESERSLLEDLSWLGIDWDEGPDVGGPFAPYRQSERREQYASMAQQLWDAGRAYPCFCSDADLAARRETRRASGAEAGYDGRCRAIPPEDAQRRVRTGETHTLRFHVPAGMVEFEDRLRGPMHIDAATFGDFVILRSSGLPTYNFACVVDDAGMRISDVIRGEDHLYNTARQCLLYDALQLSRPRFVHLALILDEERGKLSKREGRTGTYVDEYRAQGYLPQALMNFLALLGWSSPREEELLAPEDLVRDFDLDRVSKSPAVFDPVKLDWMAAWHLRGRADDELARLARPFLQAAGLSDDPEQTRAWVAGFKSDLPALGMLPGRVQEVLQSPQATEEAVAVLEQPSARRLLDLLVDRMDASRRADSPVDAPGFKKLLTACGKELGLKGKDLYGPVRAALTGKLHGPELGLLFDALGTERVQERLRSR